MINLQRISIFCCLLTFSCFVYAQNPLPKSHAHNDYDHERPLLDAHSFGFTSIEADVFEVNGELFVAHDFEDISEERTLEALYFQPLDSIVKANAGRVYKGSELPFYLMVDFKNDADASYIALAKLQKKYTHLFTKLGKTEVDKDGAVTLFISGQRPIGLVNNNPELAALDGRPNDLGKGYRTHIMPVISVGFRTYSKWNGEGKLPKEDRKKIKELVKQTHAEGKKLRFWAIPDNQNSWEQMEKLGVDFINTDKLEEFYWWRTGSK